MKTNTDTNIKKIIKKPTVRIEEKELDKIKAHIKPQGLTFQDYVISLIRKDMGEKIHDN